MDKTIAQYKGVDIKAGDDASVARQMQSIDAGTPIAVDTLSRKADPNVQRGVEIVNQNSMQSTTPALTQDINNTASILPPAPRTPADQNRELLSETARGLLETDVKAERLQAREDAGVIEKEAVQRQEYDALTRAREDKRMRIEEIQRQSGLTKAQKDAMVSEESRVFDRQIADKSFSYNVALGDYQAAEKIANDYIADLQTERQNKQNAWSMLFQLSQNDMTESEKIEAQQAFQEKMLAEQAKIAREDAIFRNSLSQNDPLYKLNVQIKQAELNSEKVAAENARKAAELGQLTTEQSKLATELRKEANGLAEVKVTKELEPNIVSLLSALEKENGVGDISAINSFQRLAVDPGVSVREGDVALLQSAQSFGDKAFLQAQGLFKGNKLTEEARKQMKDLALNIYEARVNFTDDNLQPIKVTAQENGITYDKYIGRPFATVEQIKARAGVDQSEDYADKVDMALGGQTNSISRFINSILGN